MPVLGIHPSDVLNRWPLIKPMLERVREKVPELPDMDYTLHQLLTGVQHCYVVVDDEENHDEFRAVFTLSIDDQSQIICQYCAGEGLEEWAPEVQEMLEKTARANGSKVIRLVGRAGWWAVLKKLGYTNKLVVFTKVI